MLHQPSVAAKLVLWKINILQGSMEQGLSSLKRRWAHGETGRTTWSAPPACLLAVGKTDILPMLPCLFLRNYEVNTLYFWEQTCSSFLVKHLLNPSLLKAYSIISALVGLRFVEHFCKPRVCCVRWREDRELLWTQEGTVEWFTKRWRLSFLLQGWYPQQWQPSFLQYDAMIKRGRSFPPMLLWVLMRAQVSLLSFLPLAILDGYLVILKFSSLLQYNWRKNYSKTQGNTLWLCDSRTATSLSGS